MKSKTILLLWAGLLGVLPRLYSQTDSRSLYESLATHEGVALTLSTDLSALVKNKNSSEYQPGVLTTADGKQFTTQVKPRGKYRRRIAEIPPLKLKFKKKALEAEGLDTLNELKLVLPATLNKTGDELVVREYLIYKMFEYLTPWSVRAQLINLDLQNTSGKGKTASYQVKAILLEDEEETAVRLQGSMEESFGRTLADFEPQQAALAAMFQYMIGNADWGIPEQRNVRFFRNQAGQLLLIPFDFDFSGLVNAPYAVVSADSGARDVRDRVQTTDGISDAALADAVRTLRGAREQLYAFCRSEFLSKGAARDMEWYLDTFFDTVR